MKKLLSLAVAFAVLCSMTVSSFAAGDEDHCGSPKTLSGSGYTYRACSIFYAGSTYRGGVYIGTVGRVDVPAYYMQYQARLFDGNGEERVSTKTKTNSVPSYFEMISTTSCHGDRETMYSMGWAAVRDSVNSYADEELYEANIDSPMGAYPTSAPAVPAEMTNSAEVEAVLTRLKATLRDDGGYQVNRQGKTYGSALLAQVVGEEPELIAAVGIDGTRGYINAKESHAIYDVPEGECVLIPLYDVNGVEIGSFRLDEAIDVTENVKP